MSVVCLSVWGFQQLHGQGFVETTPDVYQASGYGDLNSKESMWLVSDVGESLRHPYDPVNRFWFFAARNSSDNTPLIVWFNGGVSVIDYFTGRSIHWRRLQLAWSFQYARIVPGDWTVSHQ